MGVLVATVVSFLIAGFILKMDKTEDDDEDEDISEATEKSAVSNVTTNKNEQVNEQVDHDVQTEMPQQIDKIIFACDAGMGSSAMGASLLSSEEHTSEL